MKNIEKSIIIWKMKSLETYVKMEWFLKPLTWAYKKEKDKLGYQIQSKGNPNFHTFQNIDIQ